MSSHFFLDWILLIWLTGPTVSGLLVKGEVGQNITVPCFYTVKTEHDITSMCWGRDACPPSKCSYPIIWTDGRKVTEGYHAKYALKGDLLKGNVSLTILNAQETDSGTYCCRVEIPGWFNDKTTNLQVVVERARVSTASPLTHTSPPTSAPGSASEASFTVRTWPPASETETPETNSSISTHSQQYSEKNVYLRTGLCVGFLLILVLGLFLGRRYLRNMKKLSKFASSVAFWRQERAGNQSALEVEIHAEENIYTIH
ncbi:hepatitis A virus cellular receptor 2 homolog isoform X3 [Phasianus colchicus]|uniref:hepatitis A virus cellular receptor 2 homolog isoform X3 n=1 Tax=Phasianus colchicus TaxID=9054 RepID=UPI00129EFC8C|nr:hepatitis A virus cellular receptor 2 homolog isoform X3 [Phasianus colchicus]